MQSGNEQATATQQVYIAQVYDIVSAEDMLPFLKAKERYPNGHLIQLPRPALKVYSDLIPLLFQRTPQGWKRVQ